MAKYYDLSNNFNEALVKAQEIISIYISDKHKYCLDSTFTFCNELLFTIDGGALMFAIMQPDTDITNILIKMFVPVIQKYKLVVCFGKDNIELIRELVLVNPDIIIEPTDLRKLNYSDNSDKQYIRNSLFAAISDNNQDKINSVFEYQNEKIFGLKSALDCLIKLYDIPNLRINCHQYQSYDFMYRLLTEWCNFMNRSSVKKFEHKFYNNSEILFLIRNDCFYLHAYGVYIPNYMSYCKQFILQNNILCGCNDMVWVSYIYYDLLKANSIPGFLINMDKYGHHVEEQLYDAFRLSNHIKLVDNDLNLITEENFFYDDDKLDDYFNGSTSKWPVGYFTKEKWAKILLDTINKFNQGKNERVITFDFPVISYLLEQIKQIFPNAIFTQIY